MTGEPPDPRAKLGATVAAFSGQRFAVIDGGHFEDLPASLKRERLFARSLFLDQVDVEMRTAGPWLVALDQEPEARERVMALVGDAPAAVFWCCDAGEAILYRHLRSLAMARVPAWAMPGDDGTALATAGTAEATGEETVFFRHYDPRVLGALMPVLDAAQFSRVLGPVAEIAFLAADHGGVRRVLADAAFPPAPPGLLTLRGEQIEALNGRRLAASHRRIAACLRELQPELSARIPEDEMLAHVAACDRSGRELGLSSEAAHGKWAYLMLMSHGRIAHSPQARAYVANGERTPDSQVALLLDATAEALKDWRIRLAPATGGSRGGTV